MLLFCQLRFPKKRKTPDAFQIEPDPDIIQKIQQFAVKSRKIQIKEVEEFMRVNLLKEKIGYNEKIFSTRTLETRVKGIYKI